MNTIKSINCEEFNLYTYREELDDNYIETLVKLSNKKLKLKKVKIDYDDVTIIQSKINNYIKFKDKYYCIIETKTEGVKYNNISYIINELGDILFRVGGHIKSELLTIDNKEYLRFIVYYEFTDKFGILDETFNFVNEINKNESNDFFDFVFSDFKFNNNGLCLVRDKWKYDNNWWGVLDIIYGNILIDIKYESIEIEWIFGKWYYKCQINNVSDCNKDLINYDLYDINCKYVKTVNYNDIPKWLKK